MLIALSESALLFGCVRLLLGRCTRHRQDRFVRRPQRYLHGSVFGEYHLAAFRDEVGVDRASRAVRSHGHADGLRLDDETQGQAYEFEPCGPAGGAVVGLIANVIGIVVRTEGGGRQRESQG